MKIARCPSCSSRFDVSDIIPGKTVKCGKCKTIFKVPMLEDNETVEIIVAEKKTATTDKTTSTEKPSKDTTRTYKFSGSSSSISTSTRRYQRQQEKTRSSSKWKFIVIGIFLLLIGGGAAAFFLGPLQNQNKNNVAKQNKDSVQQNPIITFEKKLGEFLKTVDLQTAEGNLKAAEFCKENGNSQLFEEYLLKAAKITPDDPKIKEILTNIFNQKIPDFNTSGNLHEIIITRAKIVRQLFDLKMYQFSYKILKETFDKFYSLPDEAKKSLEDFEKEKEFSENQKAERRLKIAEDLFWHNIFFDDGKIKNEIWNDFNDAEKKIYELLKGLEKSYKKKPLRTISDRNLANTTIADKKIKNIDDIENDTTFFSWYYSKPYLICLENDIYTEYLRLTDDLPSKLNVLYKLFIKEYGKFLGIDNIDEQVLVMWIFSSKERYEETFPSLKNVAAAHYEPGTKRFFVYNDADQSSGFLELFFHEGTHQLLHAFALKVSGSDVRPFWFNEGLATYMESYKRKEDEFYLGSIHKTRLGSILQYLQMEKHISFKQYISFTHSDFWREQNDPNLPPGEKATKSNIYYSQAWSMIYFLKNYEDGKYENGFAKYFESVLKGGGGPDDFIQFFGEPDKLEKEWREFTNSLIRRLQEED